MSIIRFIFLLCILPLILRAGDDKIIQYREFHQKAVNAYYAKDYTGWLAYNKKALKIMPDHPRTLYYLANAYALNNDAENAIKYLRRAIEKGLGWSAGQDKDFEALRDVPEFRKLLKRIAELKTPVNNSTVAFIIPERDIIPEGMAYDPVDQSFYMSSIFKCKIIKIDKEGNFTNFTSTKQDGLRSVAGMKVDAERRVLWACSEVSSLNYIHPDSAEMGWSGVFKYDLKTGKLIKKYTIQEKNVQHLFNDIVVTSAGNVYLTDSRSQEIFTISPEKDEIEVFMKNKGFGFLNGITLSANEESIYVADDGNGIALINLNNKSIHYLSAPENVAMIGIDGLYLYHNSLVAVQNGLGGEARISRLYLDETGLKIIEGEIVEIGNPHFIIPTTGTFAGNGFYYIANAQLRSFDRKHQIWPWEELKDVVILKAEFNL